MSVRVPAALNEAVEAVRSATAGLIRAANEDEPDAIAAAVEAREAAVAALEGACREHRAALDESARRDLLESLSLEAADAEAALERTLARCRGSLDAQLVGLRATRGYAMHEGAPTALDRAG